MLRRIIPAVLCFILFAMVSLGAFTDTSFRNASTAYLLEDDYDLWLGPYPLPDPARLPLIEGARLYTNLSNLVDKSEEQFSNYDNNFFLIGGSTTPLFNLGHLGIVVDRYNDKDPWNTGLTDRLGNSMYGYGHAVNVELVDEDFNGTYDRRTEVEETREAWYDEGIKEGVFCFGKDLDGMLLGFFYQLTTTNTEEYGPSIGTPYNFTFDSTDVNLISGDRTFTESKVGTGSATDGLTDHLFGFSFWKYLNETRAVGFHFGYGMHSGTYNNIWDVVDNWDGSPDDPSITDTYAMTEASEEDVPTKGNDMTGWLSYVDDWNEITHLRFDVYFNKQSFDVQSGAMRDYSIIENRNATDNSSYSNNGTEAIGITGDGSSQTIGAGGKVIYDLTERVKFAFGLGLYSRTHDTTRVETADASYIYTYDDGDTEPDDWDDYTQTTTYDYTEQIVTTDVTNSISIPVCVEFNVTDPIVFRLGAIHTIDLFDQTTNCDLIGYSAAITHTVRGDGTESYSINPNPNLENIGSSEESTNSYSNTIYTYGMGYTVGKNLKIDLMGFYDLTDLYNWKLSATLNF
ncbi:hypothetical protein KAX75_10080 [candidate division WOR-3 bacterium]|nr:hypothetical protein [candidate division WOR-3 bacterium]